MRKLFRHMVRITALALVGSAGFTACADQPNAPTETISLDGARVVSTTAGALTDPSAAPRLDIVRDYLRQRGAGDEVDTLRVTRETPVRDGVSHLRMEQIVEGRRVVGAYVKAAVSDRGELLHLIDHTLPTRGALVEADATETTALEAAMSHLGYAVATPKAVERKGSLTRFADHKIFHRAPTVERVLVSDETGHLRAGFLVETWSQRENQLDHTLVDGAGKVVSVERRTNNESYKVFVEDPDKGDQQVVSAAGWLAPATQTQYTTYITGPNARAYLDVDANNSPDAGTTQVSNGEFLATHDRAAQPGTDGNRAVAVQNLFYLNNLLHDVLELHGFDNAHGNFEGNDPVNAEAQDGSGIDNANMSTPADGSSPRMQMYLWSSASPSGLVTAGTSSFGAYGSSFGPALTTGGVSGDIAVYNDNSGDARDACQASVGLLTGKIAVVNRGTCDFTVKVLNAQKAGAIGVIIANNVASNPFAPGGTDRKIKIPSAMISQADGATLVGLAGPGGKLQLNPTAPILVDGDLDADIVFHEYGHGLTWRMIGGMSGKLAGAIGEGASDVLAFLLNGDDVVGEYSYSDPAGIRRYPYTGYPLTYKNVTGAEVHDDGEIYAAAMWAVLENYKAANLTATDVLHDFVQGMNSTPSTPAFEDMRDGMLAAAPARACLIWRGFAKLGIGEGADGTVSRRGVVSITESFQVPGTCP